MEAAITIGIIAFLAAVMGVVLHGPGGDGLRREPSFTKSDASWLRDGGASAGSGRVLNQRFDSISQHSRPDHADPEPGVCNDLVAWGGSCSDFDPLPFHHIDNFTL